MDSLIDNEISIINNQLDEINNGERVASIISAAVVQEVHKTVKEVNACASVDQRLELLITGLQSTVRYVEEYSASISNAVAKYKLQISTLENLKSKIHYVDEEKKKDSEVN
tara:strand:+ start:137 stop:469 length:333 start_codon:yes stop_codon:yes gene_type:complete